MIFRCIIIYYNSLFNKKIKYYGNIKIIYKNNVCNIFKDKKRIYSFIFSSKYEISDIIYFTYDENLYSYIDLNSMIVYTINSYKNKIQIETIGSYKKYVFYISNFILNNIGYVNNKIILNNRFNHIDNLSHNINYTLYKRNSMNSIIVFSKKIINLTLIE